jgi:hypothetical protein
MFGGAVRSRISGLSYSLGISGGRPIAAAVSPRLWIGVSLAVGGVRRYGTDAASAQLQHWINAYRQHGHKRAGLDPLHETKIP